MSFNNSSNQPPASPKARFFFSAANPEEFRKLFGGSIIHHNIGGARGSSGSMIRAIDSSHMGTGLLSRLSDERKRFSASGPPKHLLESPRSKDLSGQPTAMPKKGLPPRINSDESISDFVLSAKLSDITDRQWISNQRKLRRGKRTSSLMGGPPACEEGGMLGVVSNPPAPTTLPTSTSFELDSAAIFNRKGLHPLDRKYCSWLPLKKGRASSSFHGVGSSRPPGGSYHVDPVDGSTVYHDDGPAMMNPLPPPEGVVSVQNLRDVISDSSSDDDEASIVDRPYVMGKLLERREREIERDEMADYAARMLALGHRGGSATTYIESARRRLLPVERRRSSASSASSSPNPLRKSIKGCDDMERIDRLIMDTMDPTLSDYGDGDPLLGMCAPHTGGDLPTGAQSWATMDRIGFPPPSGSEQIEADRVAQNQLRHSSTVSDQHWNAALKGVTLLGSATVETCDALRKLSRRYGAPSHLRSLVWMTLSGVSLKMDENEGFFKAIIGKFGLMSGVSQETIEKDLERTFPDHPYFTPGEPGVHRLRLILHALCWRHPLLGYCQSFNFMAAVLLLITDDDEATFFIMCHILENLLPNDYYSDGLMGVKVDQEALVGLLMHALPRVAEHFREIRFDIRALVPAWLMSLFVNTFPIETVLRIWDCIITENSTHYTPIPLSILVAFMKVHQESIMACEDAGELMVFLNRASAQEYDAQRLIKTAIDLSIKHSELHHIRRKVRETILVDAERRKKAKAEMLEQRRIKKEKADAAASSSVNSSETSAASMDVPPSPLVGGNTPMFDGTAATAAFALREQKEREERERRLKEISPNYYHNSQSTYQAGIAGDATPPGAAAGGGGKGSGDGGSKQSSPSGGAGGGGGRRAPAVEEMVEFSRCDGEDSETITRLTTEANRVALRTGVVATKRPSAQDTLKPSKPRQAGSVDGDSDDKGSLPGTPVGGGGEEHPSSHPFPTAAAEGGS